MISPIGKKRRRRRDDGFTLIELVLVALIILIVLGLSAPIFRRTFSDLTLKDASFSISKLINYGQEMAIIERKNFKISFDFDKGRYQLLGIDYSTDLPTDERVPGKFGRIFTLPQGISFSGSTAELIFYPDGHCEGGYVDIINLKREGYRITIRGFGRQIEINEIETGR